MLAGAARVRELRGLGSFLSYWACASCWECERATIAGGDWESELTERSGLSLTIAGGDWESELTERSGLSLVLGMSVCLSLPAWSASEEGGDGSG